MSQDLKLYRFKLDAKTFKELAKCSKINLSRKDNGFITFSTSTLQVDVKPNQEHGQTPVYIKVQPNKLECLGKATSSLVNVTKIQEKSKNKKSSSPIKEDLLSPVSRHTLDSSKPSSDNRLQEERKRIRHMTEELANAKKARQTKLIDIETAAAIDRSISNAKKSKIMPSKKGKRADYGFYTPPLTKQPSGPSIGTYTPPLHNSSESTSIIKKPSPPNSHELDSPKRHKDIESAANDDARSPVRSHKSKRVLLSPEEPKGLKRKSMEYEEIDEPSDLKASLHDRLRYQLALGAFTVQYLCKACKASVQEVESIVAKIGIRLTNPRDSYCLRPQQYAKLDIWDWPHYTSDDRKTAVKNAMEAYKLLKIPKSDPIYDNLAPRNNKSSSTSVPVSSTQKVNNNNDSNSSSSSSNHSSSLARKRSKLEEQRRRMLNPSKRGIQSSSSVSRSTKNGKLSVPNGHLDSPNGRHSALSVSPYRSDDNKRLSPHLSATRPATSPTGVVHEDRQYGSPVGRVHKAASSSSERTPMPDNSHGATPDMVSNASTTESPYYDSPAYSPAKEKEGTITPTPSDSAGDVGRQLCTPVSSHTDTALPPDATDTITKIPDQKRFTAYCKKFISEQRAFRELNKRLIEINPEYFSLLKQARDEVLGQGMDLDDPNCADYVAKANAAYLQNENARQEDIDKVDALLNEIEAKKSRLLYMWMTIDENRKQSNFTIPNECLLEQNKFYRKS